jgi:hypothetical protein
MKVVLVSVLGAAAGFLTRPCCVLPAAMSLAGVSSIGVTQAVGPYRPVLLSAGIVMLCSALWTTFRREGGVFNKVVAVSATLMGFALSLRVLGAL